MHKVTIKPETAEETFTDKFSRFALMALVVLGIAYFIACVVLVLAIAVRILA